MVPLDAGLAVWLPISFVTLAASATKSILFRHEFGGWLAIRLPQVKSGIINTSPLMQNGDPVS
jgi:hypothetical protein